MVNGLLQKTYTLNDKRIVIVLRVLVILVTFFLTLYNAPEIISPAALTLIFIFFLASDIALLFVPGYLFIMKRFRNSMFLLDVVLISSVIYLTAGMKTDLYLIYFLIIFMASSGRSLGHAFMMTIVVAAVYIFLLSHSGLSFSFENPGILLRIPFIFILSFMFLYYAQEEKRRMQARAERMDRLSMVGEMTAEIMHEIKNPLAVILGYAQILKDADSAKAQAELWPNIVKVTGQLSLKIKSILAFVRSDRDVEKSPVNIVDIMSSTLEICRGQFVRDGIRVSQGFQSGMPLVMGYYNGIEQVFFNILANAQYALVEAREKDNRILDLSIKATGGKAVVTIKDNGPGIPEKDRDRIFDPFYTTKPRDKGTGLGLSVCYKIVKDHHGDIYVRDESSPGTSFVIEFPLLSEKRQLGA